MNVIDEFGYRIISVLINDTTIPIVKVITNFGGTVFLITLAVILLIILKNKILGIKIISNLAISAGLNNILKIIIKRPRPIGNRLINETGYSFPSGHSMVSMAFYGYIIYIVYKNVKNKKIKYTSIVALSILIILIGTSRVFLGVHYITDVIGGYIVAIIYLIVYINSVKKID